MTEPGNSYDRPSRGTNFDPRRLETLAMGILDAQDGKCFECGKPLKYKDATKRSNSFDIICHPCHDKPASTIIVMDDIDEGPAYSREDIYFDHD